MSQKQIRNAKAGGFRSSRLFYHAPINPVMNDNTIYFTVGKGGVPIQIEEPDERLKYTISATASSYEEGHDPYKAFSGDLMSDCWLTAPGELVRPSWLKVNLPLWFKRPLNPDPYIHNAGVNPPPITKIEVWTPYYSNNCPKAFAVQGRYLDGQEWVTIRDYCPIKKSTPRTKWTFSLIHKDANDEPIEDISLMPRYKEYRIIITAVYNEDDQVGFTQVNFCGLIDHGEFTFGNVQWQEEDYSNYRFPRYYEKLFMQNDDNDGIIWERKHNNDNLIVSTARWYPGHYSSTSDVTCIIHPKDNPSSEPYASSNIPLSILELSYCYGRTKDFGFTYKYGDRMFVTRNGIKWTKEQHGFFRQFMSFSTEDNKGISIGYGTHLYLIEIDDEGKLKQTRDIDVGNTDFYSTSFYGAVGGIISCNKWFVDKGINSGFTFYNRFGEKYESNLRWYYQYNDQGTIKQSTCNWNFKYMNGRYFAYGIHLRQIYYNSVTRKTEYIYAASIVESTDGFKTVINHEIEPRIVGYNQEHFYNWEIFYYNDKYWLAEYGNSSPQVYLRDYGNSYDNTYKLKTLSTKTVPMYGYAKDPLNDYVMVRFGNNRTSPPSRTFVVDSYLATPNEGLNLYFKDGKPSEPYGCIIVQHGFKKHWWSDNSYLNGGLVILNIDDSDDYMECAWNAGQMLCFDNDTWHRCSEKWRY